ncbi:MAG: pitrilysin family protein [Cyclobacteriaceae bacterium]
MRLFFVPGGFQDVVKIEFIIEAGRWFEEKLGAAYFTSQLLSKGTQRKNSFEIARLFDQYGAHLEVSPGLDFVSISLHALTKNLAPVLELLVEILSVPTFPEKELTQTQAVYVQNLKVNNEKTSFVSSRVFRKNLFGEHHPYGSEVDENDVDKVDVNDLQHHFGEFFHSARVFVSGKIETPHKNLMVDTLRQLPEGKSHPSISHSIVAKPGHQQVKKGESVQASIRMGKRSLLRSHPDYVSVLFASHILGGYFGSRLMKNIREEKGLTYGISASIHGLRNDSFLVVGADVNKENVRLTFDEVRKELRALRTTIISPGELETTRNHFIGSLQSEMTTPFAHAEKIKTINLFGLQQDHYQRMITRIDNITPSEIAAVCERYFHEDTFYEVAVG